tara:strand:- start:745 stop:1332 length:588 start_codon:yes stop_codon:yes gene_type:complete
MKIFLSTLIFLITGLSFSISCSDQNIAALQVAKDNLDTELTKLVGEGQVALQMHRNRHSQLMKRLVSLKASSKRMARSVQEKESFHANLPDDQLDKKAMVEDQITQLTSYLSSLEAHQKSAVVALENSVKDFESLQFKIELIEDQIATAEIMGTFETSIDTKSYTKDLNKLIKSMEKNLDTAEAELEVKKLKLDI